MAEQVNFVSDPIRTAIAMGVQQRELIADLVLPRQLVGRSEFKYYAMNTKKEHLKAVDSRVGATAIPNEVSISLEEKLGSTEDYALQHFIPNKKIEEAPDGFDPVNAAVKTLTGNIYNGRELRAAKIFKTASNFGGTVALGANGTKKISDPAALLVAQTLEYLDAMLLRANHLVMGRNVFTKMRTHPSIVKAVSASGTDSGAATKQAIADLFEVQDIIIGDALVSDKSGMVKPWDNVFGAIHINPDLNPALEENASTFGFSPVSLDLDVLTGESNERGTRGVHGAKVAFECNELVTAKDAGFLFTAPL